MYIEVPSARSRDMLSSLWQCRMLCAPTFDWISLYRIVGTSSPLFKSSKFWIHQCISPNLSLPANSWSAFRSAAKQTVISMVNPPQLSFLSLVLILNLQLSWSQPIPQHADSDRNIWSCHPNDCNTFTDFWCFNMTSRNFKGLYLTTTLFNRNKSMWAILELHPGGQWPESVSYFRAWDLLILRGFPSIRNIDSVPIFPVVRSTTWRIMHRIRCVFQACYVSPRHKHKHFVPRVTRGKTVTTNTFRRWRWVPNSTPSVQTSEFLPKVQELDARCSTFNSVGRDQNNSRYYYITFMCHNHSCSRETSVCDTRMYWLYMYCSSYCCQRMTQELTNM
jgi:hypothetical protein